MERSTHFTQPLGLWGLEHLGFFGLFKMALIALILFGIAKYLLARGYPRTALFLVIAVACFLEWAAPGHLTYGVPNTFPPTQSVVTFTLDDLTRPTGAEWIRGPLPSHSSGPPVTVEEPEE